MRRRNRLVSYIILNIIISAITILVILFIWDKSHPTPTLTPTYACPTAGPAVNAVTSATPIPTQPTATLTPGSITITSIVGAGNLDTEVVQIQYTGTSDLSLTGWILRDSNGNKFQFPEMILYKDGAVRIHTGAGLNTAVDLYWNLSEPVWVEGEIARLIDPQGTEQTTFQVP